MTFEEWWNKFLYQVIVHFMSEINDPNILPAVKSVAQQAWDAGQYQEQMKWTV